MPFHMTYYLKKVSWIVHTPQEYSGGILGWLENWQAGGEQVSSSFCSDWASTPTTKNCSAVLQQQHKWWLPFDLRCLEGKVKQTWITINNVRSDFLKNNMKTPPFNLHQQFLLALCTKHLPEEVKRKIILFSILLLAHCYTFYLKSIYS